jgi:phosphoglucosamine mutase
MAINDIAVDVTPVGDRHVLASLADNGHSLGGEQSGHIIFADIASTGDGVLAGAMLGDLVLRSGRPLADISAEVMTRLPQVLVNVDVAERRPDVVENLSAELRAAERTLAGNGRILIRPSGTEPVVRVMVEAETSDMADAIAQHLAGAVARRFGRHPSR